MTSFGAKIGSVATPTAGLHFTPQLRQALIKKGIKRTEITLHVGIGTFSAITTADVRDHELHREHISIEHTIFEYIYQIKKNGKKVITIGTTSTRTIESLPYLFSLISQQGVSLQISQEAFLWRKEKSRNCQENNFLLNVVVNSHMINFESSLYIFAGYQRKIIDGIITNFHLPHTSLVVLVAGLIGYDNWRNTYQHALDTAYRFGSLGDGMYIDFMEG